MPPKSRVGGGMAFASAMRRRPADAKHHFTVRVNTCWSRSVMASIPMHDILKSTLLKEQ